MMDGRVSAIRSALDREGHTNVSIIGVAQTNRNPTYDIRSEVPNSQSKVGPFLNSTIDPDPFRAARALDGLCA